MADFPIRQGYEYVEDFGTVLGTSSGTVVTASASANTKGSWTQLIASTAEDTDRIVIFFSETGNKNSFLVDIGIGAASSEQIIAPNLAHWNLGDFGPGRYYVFNLHIPAGTRIAARCQSDDASATMQVQGQLLRRTFTSPVGGQEVVAIGADTATSTGTTIDPGGTANTKGSWVQITSSLADSLDDVIITIGLNDNTAITENQSLIDVAIGAASSEQLVYENIRSIKSAFEIVDTTPVPMNISMDAGARVAVRAQCSIIDATDRLCDVVLYGVKYG